MSNTQEMTPTNSALARNPKSQNNTRSNNKISQSSTAEGPGCDLKVVTDESVPLDVKTMT